MNKLNLCHFYAGNRFGGLEKFLINIQKFSNFSPNLNHSFILCSTGKLDDQLVELGGKVSIVHLLSLSKPVRVFMAWLKILKILKQDKIEVLVCHEMWNFILGFVPAKLAGVKILLWSHTSFFDNKLNQFLRYIRPVEIIANSQSVASQIESRWSSIPVKVLYYPHASPQIHEGLRSTEQLTLLYVGRFSKYKGLHILVKSLKNLTDLNFRLDVVGGQQTASEEKYKDEILEIIQKYNLQEKVKFWGEQSDVASFYNKSDIFCHPNVEPEGFGLVFIEALYCGLPIVATNIGGAQEIFNSTDKVIGKLVYPNDVEELSMALRELILDNEARKKIRNYSAEVAKKLCDPSQNMMKIEKHLLRFKE